MPLMFEQQPRESAKAFAAFVVYLNLGPERSLAAAGQKLGKCLALLERWSAKFDWAARVQAYGSHLAMVERETQGVLALSKAIEWGKRAQKLKEAEWEMSEKCLQAARSALKIYSERPIKYVNLADVSRLLEIASKLGRLATGMPTEHQEHTGPDGGPIQIELSAALNKVYGQAEPAPTEAGIVDVEVVPVKRALPEGKP